MKISMEYTSITKQHFLIFLEIFCEKIPACLSKKESTFAEEVPAGKTNIFFENISREKLWTMSEKYAKKAQFYWDINKTALYLRRERMEVEVVIAKNKLFFGFEANSVEVLQNIGQA